MRCHPKDGDTDLALNASDQDSDLSMREIHEIHDIVMVSNYSQSYQSIPPLISKLNA